MDVILFVLGVICLAILTALFLWVRRSERDIDYAALMEDSTQPESQRRFEQLGIGMNASPNRGL